MGRRTYTDEEKAVGLAALTAHGGDVSKAARACGVPRGTLQGWMRESSETVQRIQQDKKAELADLIGHIAERASGLVGVALGAIEAAEDEGKTALAHIADLNRVMGTSIDKRALLRGEPTTTGELVVRYVNDWRKPGV